MSISLHPFPSHLRSLPLASNPRTQRLRLHYSSVNKKVHASPSFRFLFCSVKHQQQILDSAVTHAVAGVGGRQAAPSWCPACFTALHAFASSIDRGTNPSCRFLTPSLFLPWPVCLRRSWRFERAAACGVVAVGGGGDLGCAGSSCFFFSFYPSGEIGCCCCCLLIRICFVSFRALDAFSYVWRWTSFFFFFEAMVHWRCFDLVLLGLVAISISS